VRNLFSILQIIIAILLVAAILVQTKGTGFGRSWGTSSSFSRRGLEKLVFKLTFVMATLFIFISFIQLFF